MVKKPPRKVEEKKVVLCPACGTPLHEVAYCWNPEKDDFDVFVACAKCSKGKTDSSKVRIDATAKDPASADPNVFFAHW